MLLLVALMMVVLCGMAALALDLGVLYVDKGRLQSTVDAAALAGADVIMQGATTAQNAAASIAAANALSASYQGTPDTVKQTFTATASYTTPLWFANALGIHQATVHATSVASLGALNSVVGAVPIAVVNQTFVYGQTYDLSSDAGSGSSGNYGFLDFSGNGSKGLETDLENGYSFPLTVGQVVATEPGMNTGPVATAIQYRLDQASLSPGCSSMQTAMPGCSRIMILPVVNTLDVSGKKDVTILGFAAFYLDGLSGQGGHQQIMGRFLQVVLSGTVGSGTNYGTYSVRLQK